MKQINKKHLCYWCLGCTLQGEDMYFPKQRCNGFMPCRPDAYDMWKKYFRGELIDNELDDNIC